MTAADEYLEKVAQAICQAESRDAMDWEDLSAYGQMVYLRMAEAAINVMPRLCLRCDEIADLIAGYRRFDPPDIAHRIYVDIETILDPDYRMT